MEVDGDSMENINRETTPTKEVTVEETAEVEPAAQNNIHEGKEIELG